MKSLGIGLACVLAAIVFLLWIITQSTNTAPIKLVSQTVKSETFTPYAKPPPSRAVLRYRVRSIMVGQESSSLMLSLNLRRQRFRPLAVGLLALPGYQISQEVETNKNSTVVGYSQETLKDGGTPTHAVCWVGHQVRDLGIGHAFSINSIGNIVGNSSTGQAFSAPLWTAHPEDYDAFRNGAYSQALLWTHGYRYDLNNYLPPHSGWVLTTATAIDDRGRIVGYGLFHGKGHAFLLTPR